MRNINQIVDDEELPDLSIFDHREENSGNLYLWDARKRYEIGDGEEFEYWIKSDIYMDLKEKR